MDVAQTKEALENLSGQRGAWEKEILSLGPMKGGSLVRRFTTCGNRNCVCHTEGKKHGPYYYVSTKDEHQKTRLEYVPADQVQEVRRQIDAHKRYLKLIRQIRSASAQILEMIATVEGMRMQEGQHKLDTLKGKG